jgi:hypothetical protein
MRMYTQYWLSKKDSRYSIFNLEQPGILKRFRCTFLEDLGFDKREDLFDDPDEQLVQTS